MDAGRCVEFGTPYELLTAEYGPRIFYGMVKQTGKSTFDHLLKIAKEVNSSAVFANWYVPILTSHKSYSFRLTTRSTDT